MKVNEYEHDPERLNQIHAVLYCKRLERERREAGLIRGLDGLTAHVRGSVMKGRMRGAQKARVFARARRQREASPACPGCGEHYWPCSCATFSVVRAAVATTKPARAPRLGRHTGAGCGSCGGSGFSPGSSVPCLPCRGEGVAL